MIKNANRLSFRNYEEALQVISIFFEIILQYKHPFIMFKTLFPFAYSATPQEIVDKLLLGLQINTNSALPQNYYNLIFAGDEHFPQTFAAVVKSLSKATTASAIIKILTIIFKAIRNKQYTMLECLQELETPSMAGIEQKDISWINDLTIAIKSYLVRLPSVNDVFARALELKVPKKEKSQGPYLSDLYRVLNVVGLLFPAITNCVNNIGRYYAKTYLYFAQFYKVIKEEVLLGYQYAEFIISKFKNNPKEFEVSQLKCFLKSISEIELYCDRTQEFTMNKYFRGKGPNKKIYFKEEEISQLYHYIRSCRPKCIKNDEFNYTNDEEEFGEFQQ